MAKRIAVDKLSATKQVKVIGPAMNPRNYVAFFYTQFQYLKIIPVYKVKTKEVRGATGFVHYYKESEEALDPRQKKFYSFVDQLVYLIQNEGAVKIRLEGSSSKTGQSPLATKEKLAYTRIEDLKDNLERELYKRGINPQRLNVVEEQASVQGPDPKKGTGKKPKGSGRRLYTDEDPSDTVSVKFKTVQDIKDTLSKESFKSKSHKRQSQIINLIHQRARAAYQNAKDPKVKARLKKSYDYAKKRKEASKEKTKRMNKKK